MRQDARLLLTRSPPCFQAGAPRAAPLTGGALDRPLALFGAKFPHCTHSQPFFVITKILRAYVFDSVGILFSMSEILQVLTTRQEIRPK